MPLTPESLAHRLQQARKAAGLSQAEAAEAFGVARPVLSQIETADRKVSSLELDRLARLYGRLPADLLEEEFDPEESLLTAFRAVGEMELDRETQRSVIRRCREVAEATRQLESALGIVRVFAGMAPAGRVAPQPKGIWQALEQGERMAIEERRRLGLGQAPVPDLVDLLEAQGILTAILDLPEDVEGLTLALPSGPFVAINRRQPSLTRRRFSLAHEYGHVLLDGVVRASVTHRQHQEDAREKRANRFAAAFLLPEEGVMELLTSIGKPPRRNTSSVMEGESVYSMRNSTPASETEIQPHDVVHLSHYFGASHLAVLYRLKSLDYLSAKDLERLQQAYDGGVLKALSRAFFDGEQRNAPSVSTPDRFHHRFLALILEALRRDEISFGRATECAALVDFEPQDFRRMADTAGVAPALGRPRHPHFGE